MPTKARLRAADSIGNKLPLESTLIRLSYRFQVAPPFMEIKKPTPGRSTRIALAGGGDDDRLVGVVIPAEDGDAADIDSERRAEVGQRDVGWAVGVGRQEVGRLPDAAAGAGDVDRVARWIGRVDRQRRRSGRTPLPLIAAGPTAVQAWLDSASV